MKKLKQFGGWRAVLVIAILFLIIELVILCFEFKYKDRFYPGVWIAGQAVGGQTRQAVVEHFKTRADVLAKDGLTVNFEASKGSKKVIIPMSTAGLTSDTLVDYFTFGNLEAVINEAYYFGRRGNVWQKMRERFSILITKDFTFPVTVYDQALLPLLERELDGWLVETKSAHFANTVDGLTITNEQVGEKIDLDQGLKTISQQLIALDDKPVMFQAVPDLPLTTAGRLAPFAKLADELAKTTTLVFRYNGYKWRVPGPTLATWLNIKAEGEVGIDPVKLATFLNKTVVPVIDNPPQNSRFEMQAGQLVEIYQGRAGKIVDVEKTIANVEKVVYGVQKSFAASGNMLAAVAQVSAAVDSQKTGGIIEVPVVIVDAEPAVTKHTIDQHGITDLIGSAKTSFAGSSDDRRKNITVGASKLNGLLIAPGEEFSVVNSIGTVTEADGYTKEYVIKDGQSIKELGGGLCQIATTMFRTILAAGLPVTERQNHRYVVGYYGPGLDATIYGPHPDLRFVNNTGKYILLQAKIEGNSVAFELYGQADGRVATVTEPEITNRINPPLAKFIPTQELAPGDTHCTEKARQGLTANVVYSVAYPGGKTVNQNFRSVYVPWQEVCLIGVAR